MYGHARVGCAGGISNMGAMSQCASMMRCCICVLSLCAWGMYSCRFSSVNGLLGCMCTPAGPVSSLTMDTKFSARPEGGCICLVWVRYVTMICSSVVYA